VTTPGVVLLGLVLSGVILPAIGDAGSARCDDGRVEPQRSTPRRTTGEVLGMVWEGGGPHLARLHARTLQPHERPRIRVSTVAAASPDEQHLTTAVGTDTGFRRRGIWIRFVDVQSLRVEKVVKLGPGRPVHSIDWISDDQIMVVAGYPTRVYVVDPTTFHVQHEVDLGRHEVVAVARAKDSVVVLTSTASAPERGFDSAISPTRLHVVSADGAFRSGDELSVVAGYEFVEGVGGRHRYPGLAVDEAGNRAFVVADEDHVVEIDLETMAIAYPSARPSWWDSFLSLFGMSADAKMSFGTSVNAHLLPDGKLLVEEESNSERRDWTTVSLVDTETWETCVMATDTGRAIVSGQSIVTWDGLNRLGQGRRVRERASSGLAVYDLAGIKRLHVLKGTAICWVDVAGSTAYAYKCGSGLATVELDSGAVRHLRLEHPVQLVTNDMMFHAGY
jgi:hypothetical protein